MLSLLHMFILLLEVFVYSLLAVTSVAVIFAILQLWLDKSHSSHSHARHSPRLTP
jgi:hypothetical protein